LFLSPPNYSGQRVNPPAIAPSPQVDPASSLWETVANPTFEEAIPPDISYQEFSNEQKYPLGLAE
jgi:hypothetical protein